MSTDSIATELRELIGEFANSYEVFVANNFSSNYLRSQCVRATTEFVFFSDCDDKVDYDKVEKFAASTPEANAVYCFNVIKHIYNADYKLTGKKKVFVTPTGEIKDMYYIPTCIYSKFIPTRLLKQIEYPNLPYSQDWAISYQLYLLCHHVYSPEVMYIYNVYPTSSSNAQFTKLYGTNRVKCYSRKLLSQFEARGGGYEYKFLRFRYTLLLHSRYKICGVRYVDFSPAVSSLFFYKMFRRSWASFIFNYSRCLLSMCKG